MNTMEVIAKLAV